MPKASRSTRMIFGIAATTAFIALCLNLSNWFRDRNVDWPVTAGLLGLLVLMTTGFFDPPQGRMRTVLSVVGVVLILLGSFFLFLR